MEAETGSDSAGSTFPLLQVGLGGPDGGVVGHVVVGGEELHLLPVRTANRRSVRAAGSLNWDVKATSDSPTHSLAGVDDVDDVVDGDARLCDVCGQNHLQIKQHFHR